MRINKSRSYCQGIKDWLATTKLFSHIRDFPAVWILLFFVFVGALFPFKWIAYIGLCAIPLLLTLTKHPLNMVYGLIGTSGSIQVFFFSFIVISLAFSVIYYEGFFKNAYVTYDVNQPHVHFVQPERRASNEMLFVETTEPILDSLGNQTDSFRVVSIPQRRLAICDNDICKMRQLDSVRYFNHNLKQPIAIERIDTIYIKSSDGAFLYFLKSEKINYQRISRSQVLRNTIMTSLIQEPSDLFAAVAVFNEEHYNGGADCEHAKYDKSQSTLFHWILILQILISWILLGVFISILYNKFRYES